ncbi:MAG: transglycosylase domain-containing protein, partial [Planctomycetales bacterium]|nr:transglycosylase domain-containing protein [Planctomycetales bacterium]
AIVRAAIRTLTGHREGGSTIAQQLARTLTGRFERSLVRKVKEIRLAIRITKIYEREHIPAYYLSVAYYGWRMNGLSEACRRSEVDGEMSEENAAGIVARLKYPEPREPSSCRSAQIQRRTRHVINLHRRHWRIDLQKRFFNIN